ncbi:MAG: cysteine desulfurase [Verrucomicrobiota bacterium]|jgi:cysteine desulfurase / selenocysteine lyase|nr:cysteine desulfurase [Verrucomicrobiota bacterium]
MTNTSTGLLGSRTRKDFPILDQKINGHPLIYLDNAATSQKPRTVVEAIKSYYEHDNANVHRGIHELSNRATLAYESARERTARFVNARSAREIVFTRGTTESINLVASCLAESILKPGDKVLITEMEHHSNMVPWQLIAQRTGAELLYLPVEDREGNLGLDRLDGMLTSDVKIFSCVHISNSLGTVNPVKDLCAKARSVGAISIIDGAQSVGHQPVDVQDIDCDFLAFSGHKICGPTGIGALYAKGDLLDELPPYHGGGEMIAEVDFSGSVYKDPPHKFEAGTVNMAGAVGLAAAMDYVDSIGREVIWEHDAKLADYFYREISRFPGTLLFGPKEKRAGLVSFFMEGIHSHDIVTLADQKGVALRGGHHCTQPLMKKLGVSGTARASFYFYNHVDEIDRCLEILERIQKRFGDHG